MRVRRKLFWLAGLLALGLLATIQVVRNALQEPLLNEQAVVLEVLPGDNLSTVIDRLRTLQVLDQGLLASWYGRIKGHDRMVKTGEYLLEPGLTIPDLYALLSSGRSVQYSIRFLEGWRLRDMELEFRNHPKLRSEVSSWDPVELAGYLGLDAPSAEGQFFPDTYFYHKGMSDRQILLAAHERLADTLAVAWASRSSSAAVKTPFEALILASIIEKETGRGDEREVIAGVFTKRLGLGMRLQTDPTVIYGLGDSFDGNLRRKHLQEPTPFNTYVIDGLPPSPIALSSEASIRAALNPQVGSYLYFVARGDGSHVFSATLEEHNRAVRAYQLGKKSAPSDGDQ